MDIEDKKVIELKNVKDQPVDAALVSFLELQLQRAKQGKIICFSCVAFTTVENSFCERFLASPIKMRWSDSLAFTECIEKEKIRFRQFVNDKFGE